VEYLDGVGDIQTHHKLSPRRLAMENALNRRLKKLHCSSFGVALILSSACAGAAPAITNLEKGPAAAELEEGARIVLSGQGFGDKLQDPAVLYDHSDSAWGKWYSE